MRLIVPLKGISNQADMSGGRQVTFLKKTILVLLCFALTSCASQTQNPSKKVSAVSSELETGQMLHEQITSDFAVFDDAALQAYVQKIVNDLSVHAKRKLDYEIVILKDERIYAISAPGGKIYITTSFLTFLTSESELAAILGHEIGQLQYLDPQFNPVKKTVKGITKTGQIIGPFFGQIGALAALGMVALQAAYARDPNLETRVQASDRWAMQQLLAAQYDPQALLSVLEHFAKYDRQALSLFYDYYQSRPITVERLNAAQQEFKKLDLNGLNLKTDFAEYQEKTASLRSSEA